MINPPWEGLKDRKRSDKGRRLSARPLGIITTAEVGQVLRAFGKNPSEAEITEIIKEVRVGFWRLGLGPHPRRPRPSLRSVGWQ